MGHAIVQNKINDHLYEKFEIEEEDFISFMKSSPGKSFLFSELRLT